jgi:hypothetical protein
MSRIILTEWPNGQDRVVVGWDHPAGGAFWQEFNLEPEGEFPDDWQEVLRYGGMWPGIPLDKFHESVPEDLRPLITEEIMGLLKEHSEDPDSGYNKGPIRKVG